MGVQPEWKIWCRRVTFGKYSGERFTPSPFSASQSSVTPHCWLWFESATSWWFSRVSHMGTAARWEWVSESVPPPSHNSHVATVKQEPMEVNKRVEKKTVDYKQLLRIATASGVGGGSLFVSTTLNTVYIWRGIKSHKHFDVLLHSFVSRHCNDPTFPRRSLYLCTPEWGYHIHTFQSKPHYGCMSPVQFVWI